MPSDAPVMTVAAVVTGFAGGDAPPLRTAFSFTDGTVRRNTIACNGRCKICGAGANDVRRGEVGEHSGNKLGRSRDRLHIGAFAISHVDRGHREVIRGTVGQPAKVNPRLARHHANRNGPAIPPGGIDGDNRLLRIESRYPDRQRPIHRRDVGLAPPALFLDRLHQDPGPRRKHSDGGSPYGDGGEDVAHAVHHNESGGGNSKHETRTGGAEGASRTAVNLLAGPPPSS